MIQNNEVLYDDYDFDNDIQVSAHIFLELLIGYRGTKISEETLELLSSIQEYLQYQVDRKNLLIPEYPERWHALFTES